MKKTVQEWWDATKASEDKLINWLKNQYHGEAVAASRIEKFILNKIDDHYKFLVARIMEDELKHASWIKALLLGKGIEASILEKEERYWSTVITKEFENDALFAAGVAAHAEEMRLERIKVIMKEPDPQFKLIQETFTHIYKDEVFHAKAFKFIAGDNYNATTELHAKGVEALGLII